MSGHSRIKGIDRIVDANLNRLKEGLRVCEEIARFIIKSRLLCCEYKRIRHAIDAQSLRLASKAELLSCRDSVSDPGRKINLAEFSRNNFEDIFLANIQRAKESARVLEEFSKLCNKQAALGFKKIRYDIYRIEKNTAKKLNPVTIKK